MQMKQDRTFKDILLLALLRFKSFLLFILISKTKLLDIFPKHRNNVRKERISIKYNGVNFVALRYSRLPLKKRPAIILNIGISSYSENHVILYRLAKVIAFLGFHAFIPCFYELKYRWIRKESTKHIEHAIFAISNLHYVNSYQIGIIGVSFGGGLSLLAVKNPEVNKKIKFVLVIGTYSNLESSLRFSFTGKFKVKNKTKYIYPNPTGRIIFLHNFLEKIKLFKNEGKIRKILTNFLNGRTIWTFENIRNLEPADQKSILSLYRGCKNDDVFYKLLNSNIKELSDTLSPKHIKDDVKKPVFIIHGIYDDMIDYGQSVDLAESLSSSGGVYLHLSDILCNKKFSHFLSNPAMWINGGIKLSNVFYHALAVLHSDKNLRYNPENEPIRFKI